MSIYDVLKKGVVSAGLLATPVAASAQSVYEMASPPNMAYFNLPDGSTLGCNRSGLGGVLVSPNGHVSVVTENPRVFDGGSDGTLVLREGRVLVDPTTLKPTLTLDPSGEALTPDGYVLAMRPDQNGVLTNAGDITGTPLGQQVRATVPNIYRFCQIKLGR